MGTQYDSDEDLLDTPDTPSEQRPSLKRKLLKSKTPSRKKLDDIFPITKKGDTTPSTLSEPTLPIDIVVHEFETKPVDVEALRSGMVRFRFLLHGGQPGSIPDPKILASMLDLVSSGLAMSLKSTALGAGIEITKGQVQKKKKKLRGRSLFIVLGKARGGGGVGVRGFWLCQSCVMFCRPPLILYW